MSQDFFAVSRTSIEASEIQECQVVTSSSLTMFFRSTHAPKEVMFCVGSPVLNYEAFMNSARSVATGLSQG